MSASERGANKSTSLLAEEADLGVKPSREISERTGLGGGAGWMTGVKIERESTSKGSPEGETITWGSGSVTGASRGGE